MIEIDNLVITAGLGITLSRHDSTIWSPYIYNSENVRLGYCRPVIHSRTHSTTLCATMDGMDISEGRHIWGHKEPAAHDRLARPCGLSDTG